MCHTYAQSKSYTGLTPLLSPSRCLTGELGCLWFTWINHSFWILFPIGSYYYRWTKVCEVVSKQSVFLSTFNIEYTLCYLHKRAQTFILPFIGMYQISRWHSILECSLKNSHFIFYLCLSFLNRTETDVHGWLGLRTNMSDEHQSVLRIASLGW